MRGGLRRFLSSDAFGAMKPGEVRDLAFPSGIAATSLLIVSLPRKSDRLTARKAGGAMAKAAGTSDCLILAGNHPLAAELALGAVLRRYDFTDHKTAPKTALGDLAIMVADPDRLRPEMDSIDALAQGVFFTRDLVNEPANVLTTTEFAAPPDRPARSGGRG